MKEGDGERGGTLRDVGIIRILTLFGLDQDVGVDAALWREADAQSVCYGSPDLLEGVTAVGEKRPPVFRQYEGYQG